jgi:hypothetical protein
MLPVEGAGEPVAPKPSTLADDFQQLAKLGGVAALVTYIAGLVIVNASLFNLGVSEFELFRPRFVATGALVVGAITLSTLAVAGTGWIVWRIVLALPGPTDPKANGASPKPPFGVRLLFLANAGIMLAVPVGVLLLLGQGLGEAVGAYAVSAVFGGLVSLQYWFTKLSEPRRESKPGEWQMPARPKWLMPLVLWPMVLAYTVLMVQTFADHVYPRVPEQFGGGETRVIRLVMVKDEADAARELGLQIAPASRVTGRVELLFRGHDFYVVRAIDTADVAVLDAKLVAGVRTREDGRDDPAG